MAIEKVLIVDDDQNICDLLRIYLEKEGYVKMDGPHRFRITAMGFHPYAIQGSLVLCEIVRSVVFPIIAAFLTTLITLAIAR